MRLSKGVLGEKRGSRDYFAFAVIAWFFSAWAFAFATAAVVLILYHREYRSDVLEILG